MILPFSLVPVLAYSLVSRHLHKYDVFANTLAASLVIGLGLLLVPSLGARGTALSVLVATLAYFFIEWVGVRRNIYRLPLLKYLWKPACASLVMATVLYFIEDFYLLPAVALAGVSYIIFLILSKAITKSELLIIKRLKPV
jgi:O-antigen/teichoic acid export membrane protein